jgi:hypothetical protein
VPTSRLRRSNRRLRRRWGTFGANLAASPLEPTLSASLGHLRCQTRGFAARTDALGVAGAPSVPISRLCRSNRRFRRRTKINKIVFIVLHIQICFSTIFQHFIFFRKIFQKIFPISRISQKKFRIIFLYYLRIFSLIIAKTSCKSDHY